MKSVTKKLVTLLCCLALMASLFVGCSKDKEEATTEGSTTQETTKEEGKAEVAETTETTSEKYDETVTLTLLIDKDSQLDGLKAVAAAIEEKFNIATEFELRPGGAEGDNLVKTRLATGDMADLCAYNSGSLLSALDPETNFLDLSNEAVMANVDEAFKSTVTVNGKVFGIPSGSALAGAWLYNKDVYAELGLEVPKSWDELMANCEKIKEAGKTAVIGSYKDSWTAQLIVLADNYNLLAQVPSFPDDYTNNKAKFATTPAALRGFEKLQEVYDKGYLNEDFLATNYDAALKMLAEGTGAHYPMLTFALPNIEANYPDAIGSIGAFAQPGDDASDNGLTVWMPGAVYVNAQGSNTEAALKWVGFFASAEGTSIYASVQKAQGPYVIKGVSLPEDSFVAVQDLMTYFEAGKTAPALEFLSPIKGPNLPQITQECGSGIKPAAESAADYDKDVEKQAKQLGIAGW